MIIGISPFGEPDARLAAEVSRAGGLGVLDLGIGDRKSREALARMRRMGPDPFGVRVGARCRMDPSELATGAKDDDGLHTVVLGSGRGD
jgi:NAD(P)H-dependent flavin oxidoreductase YrpB (nitropropane dioxygenase family)